MDTYNFKKFDPHKFKTYDPYNPDYPSRYTWTSDYHGEFKNGTNIGVLSSQIRFIGLYILVAAILRTLLCYIRSSVPLGFRLFVDIILLPFNIGLYILTSFRRSIAFIFKSIIITTTLVTLFFFFLWLSGTLDFSSSIKYTDEGIRVSIFWYPSQWGRFTTGIVNFAYDCFEAYRKFFGLKTGRQMNTVQYNWASRQFSWSSETPSLYQCLTGGKDCPFYDAPV